jgi:hypothetical protein
LKLSDIVMFQAYVVASSFMGEKDATRLRDNRGLVIAERPILWVVKEELGVDEDGEWWDWLCCLQSVIGAEGAHTRNGKAYDLFAFWNHRVPQFEAELRSLVKNGQQGGGAA